MALTPRQRQARRLWKMRALQGRFGGAAWTPANLFASGESGWFVEVYDSSTTFQNTGGTTPATANGDPIALIIDKSPNENNFVQSVSAARPLLVTGVQNGLSGFSTGSGKIIQSSQNMSSAYNTSFSIYALVKRADVDITTVWGSHNSQYFYGGVLAVQRKPVVNTSQLSDVQIDVTKATGDVQLVGFRYDGATKRIANFGVSNQFTNSEAATGNLNFIAAPFYLGAFSTGSFPWDGQVLACLALSRTLTDDEDLLVTNYFREKAALNFP